MKFGRWKAMCSESSEGESGGGTVGYHAVKVSSHGKTRGQDNSQHPKSIYPLGSGDEGFRWILNLGTTPREYDLMRRRENMMCTNISGQQIQMKIEISIDNSPTEP